MSSLWPETARCVFTVRFDVDRKLQSLRVKCSESAAYHRRWLLQSIDHTHWVIAGTETRQALSYSGRLLLTHFPEIRESPIFTRKNPKTKTKTNKQKSMLRVETTSDAFS